MGGIVGCLESAFQKVSGPRRMVVRRCESPAQGIRERALRKKRLRRREDHDRSSWNRAGQSSWNRGGQREYARATWFGAKPVAGGGQMYPLRAEARRNSGAHRCPVELQHFRQTDVQAVVGSDLFGRRLTQPAISLRVVKDATSLVGRRLDVKEVE